MDRPIRIAAAQQPVSLDPKRNGEAVRDRMRRARAAGARLVHFCEGAASGYPSGTYKAALEGWRVDWAGLRAELERTAALAAELRLWTVIGSNHPLTPPHRPHNSLYVISDRGELVGRYDKRLCSNAEINDWYTPGFDPLVFAVDGVRFGCALCIEVNFPELFVEYAQLGVDAVLFSSFGAKPTFDLLAQAHAAANNLWVSMAVPTQLAAQGPAGVIGPNGRWLTRCPADGTSDLAIADLDPDSPDLHEALHLAKPWRAAARTGEIYRSRAVLDPRSTERRSF